MSFRFANRYAWQHVAPILAVPADCVSATRRISLMAQGFLGASAKSVPTSDTPCGWVDMSDERQERQRALGRPKRGQHRPIRKSRAGPQAAGPKADKAGRKGSLRKTWVLACERTGVAGMVRTIFAASRFEISNGERPARL